jgi:hypothetical protein
MKFLIASALLIILSGCSVLEQQRTAPSADETGLISGSEGALPQKFRLHDVPHNPRRQQGTDCALDSLRMVLNYRGRDVKEGDISRKLDQIKGGGRGPQGGTSFYQMQQIAVNFYNLPAFVINNCDLPSLKAAIANRWSPIVAYRSSGRFYHAVVAVGYDDKRRAMFVHDPNYVRVEKRRYDDFGGVSRDSTQRLSCLLILPEGATEADLRSGLEKYVPKELVSKLSIHSKLPSQN